MIGPLSRKGHTVYTEIYDILYMVTLEETQTFHKKRYRNYRNHFPKKSVVLGSHPIFSWLDNLSRCRRYMKQENYCYTLCKLIYSIKNTRILQLYLEWNLKSKAKVHIEFKNKFV